MSAQHTLYADPNGSGHDCTSTKPCRLKTAVNISGPDDTISLGLDDDKAQYQVESLRITHSLTFRAEATRPTLRCTGLLDMDNCHIDIRPFLNASHDETLVVFEKVGFDSCSLCFTNSSSLSNQSHYLESSLKIYAGDDSKFWYLGTTLQNTKMSFGPYCNRTGKPLNYTCGTSLDLELKDSELVGHESLLGVGEIQFVSISLEDLSLSSFKTGVSFIGNKSLSLFAENITVQNFNTLGAAFLINARNSSVNADITESIFRNNSMLADDGALSVTSMHKAQLNITISNTSFLANTGEFAGSGINVHLDVQETDEVTSQTIYIDDCIFAENDNMESAAAIFIGGGHVIITNSSFIHNTVTSKLSNPTTYAERKGAGGAIYAFQNAEVTIDGCQFKTNTANWFGGSVAGSGKLIIINSYFENSDLIYASLGEILFLVGDVQVSNLTFNVVSAGNNVPLIWYSGEGDSTLQAFDDGFLEFHCPSGAQFRNESLSQVDIADAYKDLFYYCDPCTYNMYSLQHGYRIGPLGDGKGSWSKDFKCLPCSYGGICKHGNIKSQYNFWGYPHGDPPEVSFLPCPEDYCCRKNMCDTYDTCASNRTGPLCGECEKGMSETLFSTDCVEDAKCHDTWYFAIDLVTSAVTVLFFLYQLEIVGFVCKYLFWADVSESDDPSFAGYIKSVFYFYQTVGLLTVTQNQASQMVGVAVQPTISYLLTFRSLAIIFRACPFPGMNPVSKTILTSAPTIYVLAYIGILTAIYMFKENRAKKKTSRDYVHFSASQSLAARDFGSRLATACVCYFLFNYINISNMTFILLACAPVKDKEVLYIDGTVECLQPWQGVFILIAIIHVCPFFMAVIFSRTLLENGRISLTQFFLSYFIPLPMLVFWLILYQMKWKHTQGMPIEDAEHDQPVIMLPKENRAEIIKEQILGIIEQPFINYNNAESARHWEGILIFRRLVLSATAAFTTEPLLFITLQTVTCLIFLLWHIHVQPFGTKTANYLETISLSVLTVVGICHVIQATLLSAGVPAAGPSKTQIYVTDWIEWVLVNLLPILLILTLILFITIRLLMCLSSAFKTMMIGLRDRVQGREEL